MKLLFALLLISTSALCQTQKIDTLKEIPATQVAKMKDVKKQLEESMKSPEVQKFFSLQTINLQLQEAAFEYNQLPVPEIKEFNGTVILYIKEEKKK